VKRYLCVALAGLLAMLFCACGAGEPIEQPTSESEIEREVREGQEAYEQWSQEHKEALERPLTIADDSYYYWDSRMPYLIAQDAENDAYLYGFSNFTFGGSGAVLLYKGFPAFLNWDYYCMQYSFPEMKVADFDGCGRDEIAFSILVGKGTGWHPGRLTVVVPKPQIERNYDNGEPPSWEHYTHLGFDVYYFDAADMRKQIDRVITFKEIRGEDEILLTFSDGKKTFSGPPYMGGTFEEHVDFLFDDDGSIYMSAIAGSNCYVNARVNFSNGTFTLTNIALEENSWRYEQQN